MRSILFLAAAAVLAAQTNRTEPSRICFNDGTCIAIHTEATGNAPLSSGGGLFADDRTGNIVQRLVLDDQDHALFGYDVEAHTLSGGTFSLRIRPLVTARGLPGGVFVAAGSHIPTVAAVREFPSVKSGDSVAVDILYNPTTGEKIYDVLQPLSSPDEFAFEDARILVNGVEVANLVMPAIPGSAALVHLPNKGDYFLALNPPPGYPFRQMGRVERNRLKIEENGETVEVISKANILVKSPAREIWVYHNRQPVVKHVMMTELQRQRQMLEVQREILQLSKIYRADYPPLRDLTRQLEMLRATTTIPSSVLLLTTDGLEDLIQQRGGRPVLR
ncbi:MAG TPA: hypothetical protein VG456_02390 [Candidatus Sulfopaludibacter sp.]|jgi:hypothetical protein|nr:hypothetical protein [Candidatus Sulfopaludibacter sp.]